MKTALLSLVNTLIEREKSFGVTIGGICFEDGKVKPDISEWTDEDCIKVLNAIEMYIKNGY